MKQYDILAGFYDQVIAGKDTIAPYVIKRVDRFFPSAKTLLELGCGTGDVLKGLQKRFELTGIDSSEEMLKIARRKIRSAEFIRADIRTPLSPRKFDAVICVYDTLNHLIRYNDWKKVFLNVSEMLNPGGIFIFDVNTPYKLRMLQSISPHFHRFGDNYLVIDVKKSGGSVYNWNLKIFEHTGRKNYRLVESNIAESSFETIKIIRTLGRTFELLKAEDENGGRISEASQRVIFVCRKKP